jgi:hypothetical protein
MRLEKGSFGLVSDTSSRYAGFAGLEQICIQLGKVIRIQVQMQYLGKHLLIVVIRGYWIHVEAIFEWYVHSGIFLPKMQENSKLRSHAPRR